MKKYILSFVVISIFFILSVYSVSVSKYDMEWTMVNVNYSASQGDAHVIKIKNGKVVLIDAGYYKTATKMLVPFLKNKSIDEIDIVFISHPHKDHYEGIRAILNNNIKIKEIYFNIPDKLICDREIPWGCDYSDVLSLHNELIRKGVVVKEAKAGQEFKLGLNTWIEILYAFDGINTPVGKTGVNDLSLIMMLHHDQRKFLFTGDLNKKIGNYLAGFPDKISADILKVPHHGTESVAPNYFFEKVAPKYALVPAPKHLWLSKRSKRIRNWFLENEIPVYVNGISGNIQVAVKDNNIIVNVETQSLDIDN